MILKCLLWNFSEISCSWIKCSKIIVECIILHPIFFQFYFFKKNLSLKIVIFLKRKKKLCKFSKIKTQHKCLQNLDLLYLGMDWDLVLHKLADPTLLVFLCQSLAKPTWCLVSPSLICCYVCRQHYVRELALPE